jgi:hypothetical protein
MLVCVFGLVRGCIDVGGVSDGGFVLILSVAATWFVELVDIALVMCCCMLEVSVRDM